jgi:hypothetical protein
MSGRDILVHTRLAFSITGQEFLMIAPPEPVRQA